MQQFPWLPFSSVHSHIRSGTLVSRLNPGSDAQYLCNGLGPILDKLLSQPASCFGHVLMKQLAYRGLFLPGAFVQRLRFYEFRMEFVLILKVSAGIPNIRSATCHARAEVFARRAENGDHAAGHVFTAVFSDALHHRRCA